MMNEMEVFKENKLVKSKVSAYIYTIPLQGKVLHQMNHVFATVMGWAAERWAAAHLILWLH